MVAKLTADCLVPELTIDTTHTICAGEELTLTATVEAQSINWYDSVDATTPIFIGTAFETPQLTETTSYWIQASNEVCKTAKIEIIVTVNPLPVLVIEETELDICSGNEASLYATSANNVIFWYANETDTQYVYHGNLFVTDELTQNTTYWAQAYNLLTGCKSEKIDVTITIGAPLSAPTAAATQNFVDGMTLADLVVMHTGTLIWYANEALTTQIPETTLATEGTTYYVVQSSQTCESSATAILVETTLSTIEIVSDKFVYYPNPVKDVLNFKGNVTLKSVQIYDFLGKLIFNHESNSISNVNLSALQQGTYVLKATTDKGITIFIIIKD